MLPPNHVLYTHLVGEGPGGWRGCTEQEGQRGESMRRLKQKARDTTSLNNLFKAYRKYDRIMIGFPNSKENMYIYRSYFTFEGPTLIWNKMHFSFCLCVCVCRWQTSAQSGPTPQSFPTTETSDAGSAAASSRPAKVSSSSCSNLLIHFRSIFLPLKSFFFLFLHTSRVPWDPFPSLIVPCILSNLLQTLRILFLL